MGGGGVTSRLARKLWKCSIPLKIKVFLWQVFQNRLQTGHQLKERNWKGDDLCALCGAREDVDHLLFKCPLAEFLWAFVSEALAWGSYPRSMSELILDWLPRRFGMSFQMGLACFTWLGWAVWLTRNKICMQKTFPAKPIEVIYNAQSFV
jgi:hypothetical protein